MKKKPQIEIEQRKRFRYYSEIFLGNFYRHLATFYWSH